MRVVVVGATGNVGSAVVRALRTHPRIESIVGVARRLPPDASGGAADPDGRVEWHAADIATDSLDVVRGADVVVHLAWKIRPGHDELTLVQTNLLGTRRLIDAVLLHDVPSLVYASSVGAYSPGPKVPVDESWPVDGIPTSTYSRHKATVESMLDSVEAMHPDLRVVRMRTSLVFQRGAASEVHRLFMGALAPWHLPQALRWIPSDPRLTFQATHADDIADAYVRAITSSVSGAFNIAAEPVLNPQVIAGAVDGRTAPIPLSLLRAAAAATFAARLQPSEAGWLDMAMSTPLMDTTRARTELGWRETRRGDEAFAEVMHGMGDGAGDRTVPLHPRHDRPVGATR
jgi:nucleoside-diphosphate-sugar epimerase